MEQADQGIPRQPNQAQYSQNYGASRQNGNQAVGQYLNQLNYVNAYNQNQLYQQQYQIESQNQQMNQLVQEQDDLRKQLNYQRQAALQARQKPAGPSSRQKESDALALLDGFQRSLHGDRSDPFSALEGAGHAEPKPYKRSIRPPSYNDFQPSSRDHYDRPPPSAGYRNQYDQGGYPYGQGAPYASPFQNAANQLISPISPASYPMGFNPYQNPELMANGYPMANPYGMYPTPEKKKETSKTAEILMASLEKQNMILAELTGSINKDRDYKMTQEAKEIENKIRQLEFESQAKQYQLLSQNTADSLSKNYNRPIRDVELQKNSELVPGMFPNVASPMQLLQLQSLMGNRFLPHGATGPFAVMPSEFMDQQEKLKKLKEKQKKKDKKKKHKLQELLLLLGLDENEEDEEEPTVAPPQEDKAAGRAQKKKEQKAVDKALAEERAKQDEEKRKIDAENNRKRRKRQLQALMWTRVYPVLYYVDFYEKKSAIREQIYQGLSERIGVNQDNAKNWAAKAAQKGFDMIAADKKLNLQIVPFGGKKLAEKDLASKPENIQKILKTLMDGLINNTKQEIVPSQLLSFLGDISHDFCYPPQVYMFNFEINRLNFNHTASLKDTTPPKVQMICAFFMLIRVFIAEMILKPDKVSPTMKVNDVIMRSVKTLASILVIIITDYLRSRVVVQNGNQNHLDPELKVKPRSTPIQFIPPMELKDDADDDEGSKKKKDDQDTLISGLYTKEQLITYFQKKPLVDEIKALVEGWCNAIGEIVTNQHKDEVKEKSKR